ncbi:MAG: DUF4388 domain-containing protein [Halothece sp.]
MINAQFLTFHCTLYIVESHDFNIIMYGSLRDIDIHTLLELIEHRECSGQLLIEASSNHISQSNFWLIYFHYGQIAYAFSNTSFPLQRLQDYIRRYQIESSLEHLIQTESEPLSHHNQNSSADSGISGRNQDDFLTSPSNLPEYKGLWQLLEHHVITAKNGKQILSNMIQEIIFDLLSLREGTFILKKNILFQPRLTQFPITPLLSKIMRQLQQWKQLFPYITSPEQCPLLTNPEELQKAITPSAYRTLAVACQGQLSLRRIARYLNKDLVTISQALYPYIQRGWLKLEAEATTLSQNRPEPTSSSSTVLCVGKEDQSSGLIDATLKQKGYTAIRLKDPQEALTRVLREPPILIITPLEMPELPGDQLAFLLRQLPNLPQPPIILLANENWDPLRVTKAQILGNIEVLVSPFEKSELLQVLSSYQ